MPDSRSDIRRKPPNNFVMISLYDDFDAKDNRQLALLLQEIEIILIAYIVQIDSNGENLKNDVILKAFSGIVILSRTYKLGDG